jgi:glycosyltransferase involved in cell wall biosynthesis
MKVLFLTPYIPYPLSEGGKISQYAVIESLKQSIDVVLFTVAYDKTELMYVETLQKLWPDVEIICIDLSIRLNFKGKLQQRLLNGLKLLREYKNGKVKISELEDPRTNTLYKNHVSVLILCLTKVIERIKPDIIQVDFLEFVDLVLAIPTHIKKVFVHHELRFVRLQSIFNSTLQPPTVYEQYLFNSVKHQEQGIVKLYDGVIVFSEADKIQLLNTIVEDRLFVSPFPVLDDYFSHVDKKWLTFEKLVFVGSDGHPPNQDAIEWYINELGPAIFEATSLKLHITGTWSEETRKKYQNNPIVVFVGFVENLVEFCRNSIMLVPIRIGSGIRTKIIYAMAQGVPVVSATKGIEGIPITAGKEAIIADTREEFVDAVVRLKNDLDFAYEMSKNAQNQILKIYSQTAVAKRRKQIFEQILSF